MALHMSSLFLRTLREDPADAEVPSHRLLVRAGYVRRVSPGVYTWLPLGLRVLRNVEGIVREEMDAIGAQELLFPALLPKEPFEASGRWSEYGDNIFRLQDRKGADHLLGPTHEEMFTLTVKDLYSSYKDLPLSIYQIQTKYRDEARPRAGVLRGREFVMKDSYSFDVDAAGLDKSYQLHREAYVRIFDRLGFHYVIVKAMAGAMGGSKSEEFLATAEVGEDTYVHCTSCGYAANVEAVRVPAPAAVGCDGCLPRTRRTPRTPRRSTPSSPTSTSASRGPTGRGSAGDTLKNVVVMLVHPDGTREPLAIGVPGDREVDEKRLGAQVEPAEVEAFTEADFAANPALVKGYIGPGALGLERTSGIRYLLDPRVVDGTRVGHRRRRRRPARHRPRRRSRLHGRRHDRGCRGALRRPLPRLRPHPLRSAAASRWATSSSSARSTPRRSTSRCSTRTASSSPSSWAPTASASRARSPAIVEGNHDEPGIIWPRELAPADVHVVAAGKDEAALRQGRGDHPRARGAGPAVLVDDRRGVSPGVKFKDSELIGVPDDPRRRARPRRRHGRDQGPPFGGAREVAVDDAVAALTAEVTAEVERS